MFYSHFLLSRKGPLGVVWFAAHLDNKLRKKHITDIDIAESVGTILGI
jgi:cohesin complex subunit SCC1